MKLDKRLWGSYKRKNNRRPLCIECYNRAVYAFIEGQEVYFYCEYHTGVHAMRFLLRAWEVLEQAYDRLSQEDQDEMA